MIRTALLFSALSAGLAGTAIAAPDASSPPRPASEAPTQFVVTSADSLASSPLRGLARESVRDRSGNALSLLELDQSQLHQLSEHFHDVEKRCGGYFAFDSRDEAEHFLSNDRSLLATLAPLGSTYTIDNGATVAPWLDAVEHARIATTIGHLSSYVNRYYASSHGRDSAQWIHDTWAAFGADRSDVDAELFTACTNCSTQPSVILTIHGAEIPDEVVVVGAHLDSIRSGGGSNPEQFAPGADDDASGIATITEIIRVALDSGWRPQRTVKFMGYAAEEVGLRGSAAIANRFAADGANVVGVLQLDMTNWKSGAPHDLKFISDNASPVLTTFANSLFDTYLVPRGLVRGTYRCGYACSDHASWHAAGFPAVMATEAGSASTAFFPSLHTANDTLANMGNTAINSAVFAQFGLAFIGEIAKTSTRDRDPLFAHGFE